MHIPRNQVFLPPLLAGCAILFGSAANSASAQEMPPPPFGDISIQTAHTTWLLRREKDGHIVQLFYGATDELPASFPADAINPAPATYPAYGDAYILEPALRAVHADGNTSVDLRCVARAL